MATLSTEAPLRSVFGGAMIIGGTIIGAGMFSLPVVMSGAWFFWSVAALVFTWFCMLHSGLMILEANLNYPIGSSFNTVTRDLLGKGWNRRKNHRVLSHFWQPAVACETGESA